VNLEVSIAAVTDQYHSTITNATSSPLLLLPPELRNMIYKYALTPKRAVRVGLYYNRRGRISRSGYSAYARKGIAQDLAVALPRVCRQIYTETATMLYSENRFAFGKEKLMHKWLSKRITAQREAIRWMMLPCGVYEYGSMELAAHGWKMEGCKTREDIAKDAMKTCPNLIEMVEDKGFDKRLRGSRGQDMRCRFDDPSSGDESVWDEDSDY
jgi:hypothetical protein